MCWKTAGHEHLQLGCVGQRDGKGEASQLETVTHPTLTMRESLLLPQPLRVRKVLEAQNISRVSRSQRQIRRDVDMLHQAIELEREGVALIVVGGLDLLARNSRPRAEAVVEAAGEDDRVVGAGGHAEVGVVGVVVAAELAEGAGAESHVEEDELVVHPAGEEAVWDGGVF